ncbi:MAG TPA: SDR family NAD(P)-dependent oxidoreductase [Acidimicrobiia bacterium]|nr:SDR family NAD(P)-dependent oxidoreductase [Acidimicrobiia bacterium]
MEIGGRVALVTGAAAGIGRAVALRLAREGAAVGVADVDEGLGAETVAQIEAEGGRAGFVRVDVARDAEVRTMVDFAVGAFGGLDILVNNAGIVVDPAFPEAEPDAWMRVLDVNLRGPMLGTYHAIKAMRERGGGAVVNVASLAGVGVGPHPAPDYAATKAGVVRFSAALAPLRETLGIRVNCICPDWVDTPMSRRTRSRMTPEEEAATVPAGILAAEEIADAAVELIGDDSLAGRVMACWCDQPRSLLPVPDWS